MSKIIVAAPILDTYHHPSPSDLENINFENIKIIPISESILKSRLIECLSREKKENVKWADYMFISECFNEKDKGIKNQRSFIDIKTEEIQICNLALWIANPSPLSFELVLVIDTGKNEVQSIQPFTSVIPHKKYKNCWHKKHALELAKKINISIKNLKRNNCIWLSIRTLLESLTTYTWETRFLLFWIILEALFGTDVEITYRISIRIGCFLSNPEMSAKEIYNMVKTSYKWRSKVVHGERLKIESKESERVLFDVECLVRNAMLRILESNELVKIFSSEKKRQEYLDEQIFEYDRKKDTSH